MKTELYRFPLFLHDLAERTVIENDEPGRSEWLSKLARAVGVLRTAVMEWPRASGQERLDIAVTLTACRRDLDDVGMFEGT